MTLQCQTERSYTVYRASRPRGLQPGTQKPAALGALPRRVVAEARRRCFR